MIWTAKMGKAFPVEEAHRIIRYTLAVVFVVEHALASSLAACRAVPAYATTLATVALKMSICQPARVDGEIESTVKLEGVSRTNYAGAHSACLLSRDGTTAAAASGNNMDNNIEI